jgi:putative membrane protein
MMFGYGSHWAFWQVALMWVGMIGFWALVIWAAVFAIAATQRPPESPQPPDGSARRTLDERLARGEVDVDQYRQLRDTMDSDAREPAVGSTK